MRSKGTIVALFFLMAGLVVAFALSFAFKDLFAALHINNEPILGEAFKLNALLSTAIAAILALFFGVFYGKSRRYIEECVVEFNKVAFPDWKETKGATFTVVIVSIIASLILGVFDAVFSWLTTKW